MTGADRPAAGPLGDLDRAALAALGREYLLAGHLIDRAGMPHLIGELGLDVMRDVAIEEWMAASPVYTRRMQRLLGFAGTGVTTIFKGMQFDIGAPPEFMDFRYRIDHEGYGEFWLAHCGALMDVEPMGDEFVVTMCHHIEDPTFDATAMATNPRAQVRPIHRPPRVPTDRHPHCHWAVTIDDDFDPLVESTFTTELASTRAARLEIPTRTAAATDDPSTDDPSTDDPGRHDYTDTFDGDLQLEDFSRGTLLTLLPEVCLQGQLLARAFMLAVERRTDMARAIDIGERQLVGIAGLTARRLAHHLGSGSGLDAIEAVIALHPAFAPSSYVSVTTRIDDDGLHLDLLPCAALDEGDELTWPALLAHGHDRAVSTIAQTVDRQARCERVDPAPGAVTSWLVTIDPEAPPATDPDEVVLTSFSTGADFTFRVR